MGNTPLVTFVSPCYNHSKFIIESLESIRSQTYPHIEHIIIDDCSTDDSAVKIQKWIDENNYKCHFICHKKNMGLSYSLNESIQFGDGEFWTALATDDFIIPNRTEELVNYLLANPKTNMVVSDCLFIDENSETIVKNGTSSFLKYCIKDIEDFSTEKDFGTYKSIFETNHLPSSIMMRKSIFHKVGLYNTKLIMEDWDMWLRISAESRIGFVDLPLTYYRFHNSNTSNNYQTHKMSKGLIYTLLKQYRYCKQRGFMPEFEKKYNEMFFFSPLKKFYLTFFFMFLSPPRLYISNFFKKVKKIFSPGDKAIAGIYF